MTDKTTRNEIDPAAAQKYDAAFKAGAAARREGLSRDLAPDGGAAIDEGWRDGWDSLEQTTARPPVRSYSIAVEGFPESIYVARTPGNARAQCWRSYSSFQPISFREFLKISRIRRVPDPPGVGERIVVSGRPATRVLPVGQYVGFMRDDSDQITCSHPNDVEDCHAVAVS